MASEITTGVPQPSLPQQTNTKSPARRSGWKYVGLVFGLLAVVSYAVPILPEASSSNSLGSATTHKVKRGELLVTVTEQGTLESSNNVEIKCQVRGDNTIISVVESGTIVEPGDELFRLDTLFIEEEISERTKNVHLAQSSVARSKADVARAKLAISEYLEGRFISALATLNKDLAIAESNLLSAKNMLSHAKMMAKSDYTSELEVEEKEFAVAQAALAMNLTDTNIDVLKRFTKKEQLATLNGDLNAAKANYEANAERAFANEKRLERAEDELDNCAVKAERGGLVIYPTGQEWEQVPDIEEGATVHKDQVLLLMPDLTHMQVKVGIHESVVDRVHPGLFAKVTLPGKTLDADITSVAAVAKPAGWWSGNVVKYDTIVDLPTADGLKPGMSVEVEVILARHEDVLMVPISAVMETEEGYACWVQNEKKTERRALQIGDSNEMFLIVEEGLSEGEEVVLDPLAYIVEAQNEAARSLEGARNLELSDF